MCDYHCVNCNIIENKQALPKDCDVYVKLKTTDCASARCFLECVFVIPVMLDQQDTESIIVVMAACWHETGPCI